MTRLTALACVTLLSLIAAPAPAVSQPATSVDVATSLATVPAGATIRVRTTTGDEVEGPYRLGADSLFVTTAAGQRSVAFSDVRVAWFQQRETRRGAITGALLGGAGGGAFMGLLALIVTDQAQAATIIVTVGILGGAAAGGVLGAVVGAAIPRWTQVYPVGAADVALSVDAPRAELEGEQAGRRRVGSFEGALGYGRVTGSDPTSGGSGARLGLHAEFGAEPAAGSAAPFLTVGPEIGRFDLGSTDRLRRHTFAGDTIELTRDVTASTAGGVLRAGLAAPSWRAYGLLGLSYNRWTLNDRDVRVVHQAGTEPAIRSGETRFEHLGYTAGVGTQAAIAPRSSLGLELRHTRVGAFDLDVPTRFWTLTLTAARHW